MTDYSSVTERFEFTPRLQRVYEDIQKRVRPYGIREDTNTCPIEMKEECNPFLDVFEENPDAPYVLNLAKAVVRSWMMTPATIFPDEAVVGITRPWFPLREHFSWGIQDTWKLLNATDASEKEASAKLYQRMTPLSWDHVNEEGVRLLGKEVYDTLCGDAMFSAGGYQGHTVPNYVTLLENGLDGMLEMIDKYAAESDHDDETENLYEACRIIIAGMSDWLQMYADTAAALAKTEKNVKQKRYYEEIFANCAFVAHKRPKTLYQAVQLMWCLSLWDWVDCVGRVDQYLFKFYEKSVREGDVVTAEEAITSILFKLWENGAHNVTLSGVHEDGSDATTDLTYLMLQILRNIHDTHPRMSIRIHKGTPKELLNLAVQMWSEGMSDPTVVSDENVIPGLVKLGVTLTDARDYSMLGCQEIEIPGKSNTGCEDGVFNLAKVLEYAFHDGRSTTHPQVRVGPATGEFVHFETFEDFYNAFAEQLRYFTGIFCRLCDRGQEIRAANYAKLVKTPFTTGCLEKGKNHDMGGPIYNHGVVETCGLAAVSDSLVAIKKLVFEEQKITRQTLMDALAANFDGYEKERQMLLNMAPKFGNDDNTADAMAARVLDLFWSEIGRYKSIRGGMYTGACSLLEGGIRYGQHTGALPDGRFKGEPLGNSIGPRPGADKNGLTAMLASVAKLPLDKGVGGTTLNVVLTTKLLSNPALRENIAATLRAYLMNGGQMAQITTANLEDLLDAQIHPERHGNLIVRIGGFSIQFVQLGRDAQNEVISRYNGESA